jgi:hypothetical protein
VLQPATASNADTVQILVQARTQGGQTRAAYDVVACGPRPYSGDLLIGGSAQLSAALPNSPLPSSPAPQIQRIPDLAFYYNGVIDLGAAELVRISLPDVSPCPPTAAVQSAGILPRDSAEGVTGVTPGPLQQSWSGPWGLWHGPHAAQAWPLTGVSAAIRICPLAATKKTSWPSQSVTGYASRRTATQPRMGTAQGQLRSRGQPVRTYPICLAISARR